MDTVEQGKPRPSASRIPVPESDIKEISELDANRTHKLVNRSIFATLNLNMHSLSYHFKLLFRIQII